MTIKGIAIVGIREFVIFEVRKQIISSTSNDMATVTYKSYNQNDNLLFPHCIGDLIPENDPVRVLDAKFVSLEVQYIEGLLCML